MVGRVVSTKMQKTVTVIVESRKTHPLYKKTYAWSKKYLAHDELGAEMGDIVNIVKSRPISKNKHWIVTKITGRDIVPMNEEALKAKANEVIAEFMPDDKAVPEVVESAVEVTTEEVSDKKAGTVKKTKAASAKKEAAEAAVEVKETKPKAKKAVAAKKGAK